MEANRYLKRLRVQAKRLLVALPALLLATAWLPACGSGDSGPGSSEPAANSANGSSGGALGAAGNAGVAAIGGAQPGSGSAPSSGSGANGAGAAGPGVNGTGATGVGANGAGAAGSGLGGVGAGGTGTTPPPGDPNTVTVNMTDFTVPPGGEVFMCQDFDNPFGGADVAIGRSESNMTTGSHHLHVYYGTDGPSRDIAPCPDPFEFRPMIHLATIPNFVSEYPPKMAAKLKGTTGLRMQVHYLNSGATELHAKVSLKLTKVEPASVEKWVAQMHFNRTAMAIAPGAGQTLTTSCTIPPTFGPIGLVSAVSHMHMRGVKFSAKTSTGKSLLETTLWDEPPPTSYDPPVMLNPGDAISWTCTYDNNTGTTLGFGDSAVKNEMCIYIARFFSSPNGDDLTCETPLPSATANATAAPNH